MTIHPPIVNWNPIEDDGPLKPPECVKLQICGPAYTRDATHYLLLAYYDEEYRPSIDGRIRWLTIGNVAVTDEYAQPTHWAYPPVFPKL